MPVVRFAVIGIYGSRTPAGLAVFLRVRPGLLEGAHAMDPEMHHGHMGEKGIDASKAE